jgi:DNA topoisomerase-1
LAAFGRLLPHIRRGTARDPALAGLPRRKVLALVVRLLQASLIRVGNAAYRRENGFHGLTTLRDQHAVIRGSTARFRLRGKGGKRAARRASGMAAPLTARASESRR